MRLDALDRAALSDLDVSGFDSHALHGKPKRHTLPISGPWCITFAWEDGDACRVDLKQYH